MRLILACLSVAYAVLFAGCIDPISRPTDSLPIKPISDGGHSDEAPSQGVAVSVAIPAGAWEWLAQHTPRHSLTINDEIAVKDAGGVAVKIPAGTTVAIAVTDETAELTFSKPFPSAKKLGITLDVKSIQLKQDGTGLARTAIRNWAFRWADSPPDVGTPPPQAAAKTPRRVVWVFTAAWCQPCKALRSELAAAGVAAGDTDAALVRFVDVDANPDLWQWYARRDNRIPQAAFFEGDQLLRTVVLPTAAAIKEHAR